MNCQFNLIKYEVDSSICTWALYCILLRDLATAFLSIFLKIQVIFFIAFICLWGLVRTCFPQTNQNNLIKLAALLCNKGKPVYIFSRTHTSIGMQGKRWDCWRPVKTTGEQSQSADVVKAAAQYWSSTSGPDKPLTIKSFDSAVENLIWF